ncbi:MAG: right-handed parallel beta-helix repeat-containing protein [Candidatus Bathyarchaeota archaeon]|nr:right-handed parallel beta-helix repeat-containing protein [Candidatus Bathyarchaeum sp.]
MKKLFSSFIILSILLLLFVNLQSVCLVSANFFPASVPEHTIEITATGDVTGTEHIQRSGSTYTFTADITGSIVIFCNNIVVDGAGYTLQGNGTLTGIWLQELNNVEIKNLHIKNFSHGIQFTYGNSMDGCSGITVSANTLTDNNHGITLGMMSDGNNILGNTFANNTYGVYINHSPDNTFRDNQLIDNTYNLWVNCETSVQMTHFTNDIDTSNTINGKPIVYWVNQKDKTVPSNAAYVALVNCTNITVQNQTLTQNSQGILLVATSNCLITNNHITNNDYGIVLFAPYEICSNNTISKNIITANNKDGINSWNSEHTLVTANTVTGNQQSGILFYDSRRAIISENTVTQNTQDGIKLWGHESNDNTVHANTVTNNQNGINLDTAFNNTIVGNTIQQNSDYGIILDYTIPVFSNNTIYQNNFNNTQQATYTNDPLAGTLPDMEPATDRWDNGTTGNYWSNYNGTGPYIINENNQDNHPLTQPTTIPEFQSWIILPILITTTLAITLCKQKLTKKHRTY